VETSHNWESGRKVPAKRYGPAIQVFLGASPKPSGDSLPDCLLWVAKRSDQAMPVGEEVRIWTETLMSRPVGASPIQPKRSQQAGSQACSRLRKEAVEA